MAGHRISDIADALGATVMGDGTVVVTGLAEPAAAGPDDLALAMTPTYAESLSKGAAVAAVIAEGMDWEALGLKAAVVVRRPRFAMAGLTKAFDPGPRAAPGIHPSAVIDPTAEIGPDAAIGPLVVIGPGARIGADARIGPQVTVDAGASIGASAILHAGARIGPDVVLGDHVFMHQNAVVGSDGFSFVTPETSQAERTRGSLGTDSGDAPPQSWQRIHALGTVILGDDVEVGAGSVIDRGTIAATTIGRGTKLDNLVHIGHNCQVGQDCLICGHVALGGSVTMGDRVVLGGKCGVSDNVTIGSDVVAAGATKIFSNVPSGRMMMGSPAVKMDQQVAIYKALRRLPRMAKTVAELQKALLNTRKTP